MSDSLSIVLHQTDATHHLYVSQNDQLIEYYQTDIVDDHLEGRIYVGTVERVLPALKAAFIKFGRKHNGFLPLQESPSFHKAQGTASLQTGQEIIVQVKKDEKGDKGAFLTRDIAFPGQYVLLMPLSRFVGMSKRIAMPEEKERAMQIGKALSKKYNCGLIVRHASLYATLEEIEHEVSEMLAQWVVLKNISSCLKAPALLHNESAPWEILWRDYHARYEMSILSTLERPQDVPSELAWETVSEMELEATMRAKKLYAQQTEALGRFVSLPKGGSLVIDEREALQTIDVNSGSVVEASADQSMALLQNLNAVPEIARQIRLRNLSGIILIDFIDMKNDEERMRVQEALQDAISSDRVKQVVHGFTKLGLLEMTRKRTRDSLRDLLTVPCKHCQQNGFIPLASQTKG